ncbi:MAG: transcriptional repressor [Magnetococcales bacterium]|nr:transcriptional repressor [Magnetococcales bacterium]
MVIADGGDSGEKIVTDRHVINLGRVRIFPDPGHDHEHCESAIMARAAAKCQQSGARLTEQRRLVLQTLARSHCSMGAYDILDKLREQGERLTPVAIYRQLDFLMDQGLVHRLSSLNAFVVCLGPEEGHGSQFLICTSCGVVAEVRNDPMDRSILDRADQAGFEITQPVVEVMGLCRHCRDQAGGDHEG